MDPDTTTSTVPSPGSQALLSTFTTLYDDEYSSVASTKEEAVGVEGVFCEFQLLHRPGGRDADEPRLCNSEGNGGNGVTQSRSNSTCRTSKSKRQLTRLPGYFCFSSTTLQPSDPRKRSSFDTSRRQEVAKVRRLGACLRCRLLKRPCSGGNPCRTCVAAAVEKLKTKALTWMECIRPSFEAMSIFESLTVNEYHHGIIRDLIERQDTPISPLPFEVNLGTATEKLLQWLLTGSNPHRQARTRTASPLGYGRSSTSILTSRSRIPCMAWMMLS
ncbi:hypothetical protein K491DRAFT_47056 [Lophiostoma macrostomum CBS 122681]|uniref:Zn(2)-C6 fungal-type domain-containing protein n=1 Tax=Lophiostoma macrostomum CBS 122681 TaxID=1314788 RepID=A0A6A6T1S3_9PLEO|nr:hypothetical protein K491DRAFT_47056 [Lophiostoma macrostomum CBS 122681]